MPTRSIVHRHVDEALGDDPHLALIAIRQLVTDDLPWLERGAVRSARSRGYEWARIARLLQRSRQAVWKRFASIDGSRERLQFRLLDEGERIMAAFHRGCADARRREELAEWERSGDIVPW